MDRSHHPRVHHRARSDVQPNEEIMKHSPLDDAILMAAAPDLLAALQICRSALKQYDDRDGRSSAHDALDHAARIVSAAIAKAEGKQ